MLNSRSKKKSEKKMTYEEWEQERLRRLQVEEAKEAIKRRAALRRHMARIKKMAPVQALEKDDKTLIHEHWDEKYG